MLSYNLGTGRGDKEGGRRQQYRSRPRPVHVDDDKLLARKFHLDGCVEALPAV